MTCIFDMRVTQINAPSYRGKDPVKVLEGEEAEKKANYLQAYLDQRQHVTHLVYSVGSMAGDEERAVEKKLASALDDK